MGGSKGGKVSFPPLLIARNEPPLLVLDGEHVCRAVVEHDLEASQAPMARRLPPALLDGPRARPRHDPPPVDVDGGCARGATPGHRDGATGGVVHLQRSRLGEHDRRGRGGQVPGPRPAGLRREPLVGTVEIGVRGGHPAVPLGSIADGSRTPTSKAIGVRLEAIKGGKETFPPLEPPI